MLKEQRTCFGCLRNITYHIRYIKLKFGKKTITVCEDCYVNHKIEIY